MSETEFALPHVGGKGLISHRFVGLEKISLTKLRHAWKLSCTSGERAMHPPFPWVKACFWRVNIPLYPGMKGVMLRRMLNKRHYLWREKLLAIYGMVAKSDVTLDPCFGGRRRWCIQVSAS